MSRCVTPLIEICDTTSRIKLDLSACGVCEASPAALLLREKGCDEYETICEPVPQVCCGVPMTNPPMRRVQVLKPKNAVIYPLHEIDTDGQSVFILDNKLKTLRYGRLEAVVLLVALQKSEPMYKVGDMWFKESAVRFDVEYKENRMQLKSISTEDLIPHHGDC